MNFTRLWSKTLIQNGIIGRSYYINRVNKATLYSRLSPLGSPNASVTVELDDWLKNGGKVRVAELKRIIKDFRQRGRFTHALQVSEWMNEKGICAFTPTEHAVQLDLMGKVRGFVSAESYFSNLRDQDKTVKTYGALLNCYVRQRQMEKSLSHWQKMKELGMVSSSLPYNDMMSLYTNLGQHEKVIDVMSEMKENNVSPNNFSYRICLKSYGARSNIDGMERTLREMEKQPDIVMDWNTYAVVAHIYIMAGLRDKAIDALKKSEERLEKKDGSGFNHLISLYAHLGDKAEVLRLWGAEKSECKRYLNKDFVNMLESLVKLNEIEEAEKVLKEWESSGNCYDFRVPRVMVVGYSEKGLCEKAEELLDNLTENRKITMPKCWELVAAGYVDKGQMKAALKCMNTALCQYAKHKGWQPKPEVIAHMLSWLGDEGSVEDAETFVYALRIVIPVDSQMYNALLKSYIRNGKGVDKLLEGMKSDNVDEDEETKRILAMMRGEMQANA